LPFWPLILGCRYVGISVPILSSRLPEEGYGASLTARPFHSPMISPTLQILVFLSLPLVDTIGRKP
jgi:hypothetical protein